MAVGVDAQRRRDLKKSKGSDTCDVLQGLPIYDANGGYVEYDATFMSIDGEEKAMSYTNLAQEYLKYLIYLVANKPGTDPNANQPYENLQLVYSAGAPTIAGQDKYVFLPVGPVTAWSVLIDLNPGDGGGGGGGASGFQNFLKWNIGSRFFDIIEEDASLVDNDQVLLARLYTETAISNSYYLFFQDSKLSANIGKCKLDDPLTKLVKGDPFDASIPDEELRFNGIGGYFVLLPPGLPKDVYEVKEKFDFAKFFPPNSFQPTDFVVEGKREYSICVGGKKYCKDKLGLKQRALAFMPFVPSATRKLLPGGVRVEEFKFE